MAPSSGFRRFLIALLVELGLLQQAVSLDGFRQSFTTRARHFVILARRTLLGLRDAVLFPLRGDIARAFQSPQRRIDRPAWQTRDVYDVEPVLITAGHCLQDRRGRVGEKSLSHGELLFSLFPSSSSSFLRNLRQSLPSRFSQHTC